MIGTHASSRCNPRATARRRRLPALLLAASLASSSAQAQDPVEGDPIRDAALGATAGLCTLVYTPIKLAYAVAGLPIAGTVLLLSGFHRGATQRVASAAVGGDYVVTPDHLERRKTLRFVGGP